MSSRKGIVKGSVSQESTALRKVLGDFEGMVGGRESLAAALATVPLAETEELFLRLLEDPLRKTDSLLRLCQDAGVPAHGVMGLYRKAMTQQAEGILFGGLPRVVRGVVEQASEGKARCPECGGEEDLGKETCETCRGKGYVWRKANLAHQELVMDAAKMLPKGGGVNVQVDQRVGIMSGAGLFDKFVAATDGAAYAIDGVVAEAEGEYGTESRQLDAGADSVSLETGIRESDHRRAVGIERTDGEILHQSVERRDD